MFMVSVHASICALSRIHIVVSVHARHPAHFSKILYGIGYSFNLVPILWVGSGPVTLDPPPLMYPEHLLPRFF